MTKHSANAQPVIVVQQEENADKHKSQAREQRAAAWTGISHSDSMPLPLTGEWILWRWGSWGHRAGDRRNSPVNMAFGRRQCSSELHRADGEQDDRPRIREREKLSAHLVEKEQHADDDNDGRSHQAPDCATPAIATNTITHRVSSSPNAA